MIVAQQVEMLIVVRGLDSACDGWRSQRRGVHFGESDDSLPGNGAFIARGRRQIEQHDGQAGICSVRSDLRTHHAGT